MSDCFLELDTIQGLGFLNSDDYVGYIDWKGYEEEWQRKWWTCTCGTDCTILNAFLRSLYALSSVQSLSRVRLFVTPWTAARQASLSITNSWSPPKPMSIASVMPSNHLILCGPVLLLPSIFPSIRVFFQWVSSLHQVVKVLELQLQHPSFQWIFRTDFL